MGLVVGGGELFALYQIFRETRRLLASYLVEPIDDDGAAFLATETLSHIEAAQCGLRQSVRAADADLGEWRYLLRTADVIETTSSPDTRPEQRLSPAEAEVLAAIRHARLLLSILPSVPDPSFPGGLSYRDIPVPHGPADISHRLDEIERSVWSVAAQPRSRPVDLNAYRRVYGFFEAGSWHTGQIVRQFGQSA